jgi:hypothetical protein
MVMRTLLLSAAVALALPAPALASCAQPANAIEAENCLPGSPQSAWDVSPAVGNPTIEGFSTEFSHNVGETISFKIDADAPYRIDIYRLGYYGGLGGRLLASVNPTGPLSQPPCQNVPATGLIDCGNWSVSATWAIPAGAVSGLYVAKLVRLDNGGASHVPFVVRNDAGTEKILFMTADTTWQAYNPWGGNSLYIGSPTGTGAYKVSYNRPFTVRGNYPTSLFHQEYPMLRWLEANGYDVAYFSNVDNLRRGALIQNHAVFMPVGHQEYWSPAERASVEAARAAGVHMAFFSSVAALWKTRWENALDGSAERTLVCYKESSRGFIDPSSEFTGLWRDKRAAATAGGGGVPESLLTGHSFSADAIRNDTLLVPALFAPLRFWRNTGVAGLTAGQVAAFAQTVGMEWDVDWDNGDRPAGVVRMSSTTVTVPKALITHLYAENYPITHRILFYKHASGGLVFSAGTMQWGWALENVHSGGMAAPVHQSLRQATVNILGDMGAQPATLQPGLVPASPSTDTEAPVAFVTPPTGVNVGQIQTITGTATDGGGVVGAVEVSTDNASWHPAEGRSPWKFAWLVTGPASVRARAVDDSGNIGSPTAPLSVAPGSGPPIGPAIAVLEPSSATVGSPGLMLTVEGSGFMSGSIVQFDGENKPTTYMGPNMLQASIAADDLMSAGAHTVTVLNPSGIVTLQAADFMVIGPLQSLADARVFPNPWRADRHGGMPVTFGTLPPSSTVKLFTASGRFVRALSVPSGTGTWDLRDDEGGSAASGYYLYLITDGTGSKRRGTLALIR